LNKKREKIGEKRFASRRRSLIDYCESSNISDVKKKNCNQMESHGEEFNLRLASEEALTIH
jgi:hypothetical protein